MHTIKRRDFIRFTAAAAPVFSIGRLVAAPLAKRIGQGRKIRVALIGCGARMGQIIEPLLEEEIVAVVDPDPRQCTWILHLAARIPGAPDLSKIQRFSDYRVLFEKMGDQIDAAVIATPNHHHAPAALLAIRRGIHVFVEKPMASTVEEARLMGAEAKKYGVVTQVGNFGHSTRAMQVCVDAIKKGLIGEIRDVWCYDDRLNAMRERPPAQQPPKGMDWDLWCGPAPVCDYYGPTEDHMGLHPHDWHSWIGYGNGSIGNMGTHILDAAFWALDLGAVHPVSVEARDACFACPGAWAWRDTIDYTYPSRGSLPPVTVHWWDGVKDGIPYDKEHVGRTGICHKRDFQNLPPAIEECEKRFNLAKAPFANMGSLFIGDKGVIWFSHHSMCRFFPKTLARSFKGVHGYKNTEHVHEFYAAIRERREANTGFGYSTPLAETVLLGNVAARAGKKKLLWDGTRITNDADANAFLKTSYRSGWHL